MNDHGRAVPLRIDVSRLEHAPDGMMVVLSVLAVGAMASALLGCGPPKPQTTEEFVREQLPKDRKMAEAENAEAQYRMGLYAMSGTNVPQSTADGILWWRKAADQNYLPAEHDLGVAYSDGKIVPQDLAEGIRWLRKVAEQGEDASGDFTVLLDVETARSRLGTAYWYGSGVKRDYVEAVKWYRKAAEQGDGLSQYALSEAYGGGKGVRRDYVQAHMWANLAVVSGEAHAERDRNFYASQMTPKQIEEAGKLAREWKPSKQAPKPTAVN
jgi:TPR repeat protein